MNQDQALALVEHIQQKVPGVKATFDARQARGGHGYKVNLLLKAGQRVMTVNYLEEWESIKQAWQLFLLPAVEEKEEVSA